MSYQSSEVDQKNIKWFLNDATRASLFKIKVTSGEIRGLHNFEIKFQYPITAIAGRNGSGKTTILALAACAYHNDVDGYKQAHRKLPYFTFADFFIQAKEDIPLEGIVIRYDIFYNKWRKGIRLPNGIGVGLQHRRKNQGGRWNDYSVRVKRNVIFLGINRVVPHSEKSVSKSYKQYFKNSSFGWEDRVRDSVGRIVGRNYQEFELRSHTKYRLPIVSHKGAIYSGFNMGAGEDALFEMFSEVYSIPSGSLIIIDEIELGLHEESQAKLIHELKNICNEKKLQIICTTHSPRILEELPPEGRVFLERIGGEVNVIPGISPSYATGKLSGIPKEELDILVEDEVAEQIIKVALDQELRSRIRVLPVGSAAAVMRHLAVKYKEDSNINACVFLDGDQKQNQKENINIFLKSLESHLIDKSQIKEWVKGRIHYLPGDEWPERWVMTQKGERFYIALSNLLNVDRNKLEELSSFALSCGKHNEFHAFAEKVKQNREIVNFSLIKASFENSHEESKRICSTVTQYL